MEKCLKCKGVQYSAKLCKRHYAEEKRTCGFGWIKFEKEMKL